MVAIGVVLLAAVPADWTHAVSGMEKVRPGAIPEGAASAVVELARGECEAVQFVVRPPLSRVTAEWRPAGAASSLPATLSRVAYVPVKKPSNLDGAPGLWPDPLVSVVDAYRGEPRRAFPADSTRDAPLVAYLQVCAPENLPAGESSGAVVFHAPGLADARIPVELRVLRPRIPATSTLLNTFGLSLYSIAKGHHLDPASADASELLREYMLAALSHRVSLHGLDMTPPPLQGGAVDFTAYDARMAPFFDGTASPSGARFTTAALLEPARASDEARVTYARAFREHFAARHWPVTLFFYAKDEPRPDEIPLVLSQAARLHRAGIPVLVTSAWDERLKGAADLLCPNLNCFFSRSGPATCPRVESAAALRERLGRVWWYQSCSSHGCEGPSGKPAIDKAYSGWASYMVDAPSGSNRAMGALAFLEGVDGELYFDTVYAYDEGDPWTGAYAFGGNGDGTLFYPGTPARVGGTHPIPIESLRLQAIRAGLEDYELLRQLEWLGDGAFARSEARRVARSGYEIEKSPAAWDAFHRAILERLDARVAPPLRNPARLQGRPPSRSE